MIYAKAAVNVVEAFLNEHGPKKELLVNAAKNLTGWGVDGAERNMIWTYAVQALRMWFVDRSKPKVELIFYFKELILPYQAYYSKLNKI